MKTAQEPSWSGLAFGNLRKRVNFRFKFFGCFGQVSGHSNFFIYFNIKQIHFILNAEKVGIKYWQMT